MASTTSKSLQQEIYKPKHPLPEELQKLDHDETVCQFCGVSYLIHNEIKRLEDELEKYKLKLKSYEGYDQREAELKRTIEEKDKELKKVNEEFKSAISRQNELMQNLNESNHLLETAKTEITKLKRELQKKEDDVNKSIKRTQQFHLSLTSLLEEVSEIRKSTEQVKQEYSGIKDLMKTGFSSAKQSMKEHIEIYGCYKEKIELQRIQATKELDITKKELKTLKANLLKSEEEIATGKEAKRDLEKSQKTIEGQKSDLAKIGSERDALSDALTKMKVMLSERGRKVDSLESAIQEKDRTAIEARSLHEKTIEKFKFELEAVNKKCQEHQREIETVKQSSKNEKEAMSSTAIQLKVLKESLDASRNEISTLKKERQDMIDAHQNRIQQLRESFNEKISEANLWPKKLEEKLTEQQLRFNEEKTELWQQLTKSFEKEMQDLSARHQQEKQQMESKENNLKTKLKEQLETLQRRSREEIENLKANLDKEKEKNSKIIQSQESLIQNLDHKVQHLESRLVNTQKKSSDDFGVYKQKYSEAQKMMELMKTEQKNLEKELNEKQKEIDVLQDTVRRECEERFELTEALSEARLQLLANNRQTTRNRSAPDREMVPSPPMSSTERGRRDFKRRLKLTESKEKDRTDMSVFNLNRSVDNNGVTFDKVKESLDESYNRKRIADAVAKQRASSRTGFNKLL